MAVPQDRRYIQTQEWFKPEGELVKVGISQFAVDELTDITYLEISAQEGHLNKNEPFGEIESVKATSELYTGIAGEVVEVNNALLDNPAMINDDPYEKGWMLKIKPDDAAELEQLLDAQTYEKQAGG